MSLKDKEFETLINSDYTTAEQLVYFREKLVDKIKELSRKESKTDLILIIVFSLYFLINVNAIDDISLGPIQIIDTKLVLIFIPIIFSLTLLRLIILYNYKRVQINSLSQVLQKIKPFGHSESELRILIPFDITSFTNVIDYSKGKFWGVLLLILYIPVMIGLVLLLYGIQFYWLFELIPNWNQNWLFKASIIFTGWVIFFQLCFFMLIVLNNLDEND